MHFHHEKKKQCSRSSKKGGLFSQHYTMSQTQMYKIELSVIHKKNRMLAEQIKVLQKHKDQIDTINRFD